MDTKVF